MKKFLFSLCFTLPLLATAQTISPYIVTDQLGYRPSSKKVAILRDPVSGYDAAGSYTPGASFSLVDAGSSIAVLTGNAASWKSGITDTISGDKIWRFDFSSFTTPGIYYVLDVTNNLRSYAFEIKEDVYNTA
jgi:endoglucanase